MTSAPAPARRLRLTTPKRAVRCEYCAVSPGANLRQRGEGFTVSEVLTACEEHTAYRVRLDAPLLADLTIIKGHTGQGGSALGALARDLTRYVEQGGRAPLAVAALRRLCLLADTGLPVDDEALTWAVAGFDDAALVAEAKAMGGSADEVYRSMWRMGALLAGAEFTARQFLAWEAASRAGLAPMHLDDIAVWVRYGVAMPEDIPAGMSADDLLSLNRAGIRDLNPDWAGAQQVCPRLLRHGRDAGHAPRDVVGLFTALRPAKFGSRRCRCTDDAYCEWDDVSVNLAFVVAEEADRLDWADVTACLHAGMRPEAAIDHVRTSGDMEPVRLLAALA